MPKFTKEQVCEAVDRAHKWAHANKNKIAQGVLAEDATGKPVSATNPKAVCFCALGRLAKELNLNIKEHYGRLVAPLDLIGLDYSHVYALNDSSPGRPAGFDLMKEACDAQNA